MLNPDAAQRVGVILLAAVLIGVGIYDLLAALFFPAGSTISEIVLRIAMRHPVLPLMVGMLAGHLFWPQRVAGTVEPPPPIVREGDGRALEGGGLLVSGVQDPAPGFSVDGGKAAAVAP